ncbi:MAG TPA: glutamine synthetase III [Clostridia bacterium]|nr:glutamine synthetase III [Clostridia bacterium]
MTIQERFGIHVFHDEVMERMLPAEVFLSLRKTRKEGGKLDESIAEPVADAMLKWAIGQGATHYLHWFQPLTNAAAGKSEGFLEPCGNGTAMLEFSSRALVQGEPDASSFPSGGIRNTFEARGYTAWDPTSSVFVKDKTLYIPTAFCGPSGISLDQKTPLLRSMDAVSRQAVRILRLLGDKETARVIPMVGAEQEYFLVDRERYEQRLDLKLCGRTLIGAPPPKSQELDDHYFGRVRLRISSFMHELDETLWELGVTAKTKHNEVAPTQHELATVFDSANITCDANQLIMEIMKEVAKKHNLACLLHEKPFARVNGSGKHNNYSLCTDKGKNLLSPGEHPENNLTFILFLAAFVRAADRYAAQLRLSTATPGNDHRLGGFEAPPAIISMFLGERYTNLLAACRRDGTGAQKHPVSVGVDAIPSVLADDADRNRTSPFAFTGNKFEFRMVGSAQSIALANIVLNAMICDSLDAFAAKLENSTDIEKTVREIACETYAAHGRIIMNGNNYSEDWKVEAARRGLPAFTNALDAAAVWKQPDTIDLFGRFGIFSPVECHSRYEIMLENYSKITLIEANTLLEMMQRQVLPAVIIYTGKTAESLKRLRSIGLDNADLFDYVETLSDAFSKLTKRTQKLRDDILSLPDENGETATRYIRDVIQKDMQSIREISDFCERMMDKDCWPMPTYTDLMHRV